jgi:hypothetical protein
MGIEIEGQCGCRCFQLFPLVDHVFTQGVREPEQVVGGGERGKGCGPGTMAGDEMVGAARSVGGKDLLQGEGEPLFVLIGGVGDDVAAELPELPRDAVEA